MVSAWSAANGISLGQVKVDDKSNEITAIPLLINSLELSGCIVTIDAMGCQKDITQTIIEHDANYIIAIKENKKKNYQLAKQIIDDYQDRDEIINRVTRHVSENAGYGRIEKRNCTVVSYGSIKVKNAARNFSVATKMALTMLKNEKTTKGSMNLKRLKAGWDENYLSQLLRDNNF